MCDCTSVCVFVIPGGMCDCTSVCVFMIPGQRELKLMIPSKMAIQLISFRIISPAGIQTGYFPQWKTSLPIVINMCCGFKRSLVLTENFVCHWDSFTFHARGSLSVVLCKRIIRISFGVCKYYMLLCISSILSYILRAAVSHWIWNSIIIELCVHFLYK